MRSKWSVVVSLFMMAGVFLSACAEAPVPPPSHTLRVQLASRPNDLDPQKTPFGSDLAHLKLIYEGLTRLDKDLNTVPAAAAKWKYNNDATVLTFTLRDDLKYSDGSLLNAKRFEYSILRAIDPATGGDYASLMDDITGTVEWRSASTATETPEQLAALKAAVGVHALDGKGAECTGYAQTDCTTLQLTLKQPAAYFHTILSLWIAYPAKQELVENGGASWFLDPKNQIGNGPMMLTSLSPAAQSTFVPNPNYWRGSAQVNLQFKYIVDSSVAFTSYKKNEVDILTVAAENLASIRSDPTLEKELRLYPGSCTYALVFNQMKAPFTDQKVREAFAYGLDRDAYVSNVLKGSGKSTLTWIPRGFPGYDAKETRWAYDPEKAQQALAESSYGSVENLPAIALTYPDTPRSRTSFEWIAANYKDLFGIDLALDPVESSAFSALNKEAATVPQITIRSWCADYPDPQNWLSAYWKTDGVAATFGYSNPEVDALLQKADATTSTAERMKLYDQAQTLITDTVPVAFWYTSVDSYLVKPEVQGIQTTAMDSDWPGSIDPLSITIEG